MHNLVQCGPHENPLNVLTKTSVFMATTMQHVRFTPPSSAISQLKCGSPRTGATSIDEDVGHGSYGHDKIKCLSPGGEVTGRTKTDQGQARLDDEDDGETVVEHVLYRRLPLWDMGAVCHSFFCV